MSAISSTFVGFVDRVYAPFGNVARTVFDRFDYAFDTWFKAMDRLERILWIIALSMAVVLVVIVTGQVVSRYIFSYVPVWGGELARYLGIWASLLLLPALVWSDRHLQVEFVFEKMTLRMRRRVRSLQLLIITAFASAYTYYGWDYAMTSGFRSTSTSLHHLFGQLPLLEAGWRLDMFWVYFILPLSGALFMLACISKFVQINYNPTQLQEDYSQRYGAVDMED